MKRLSLGIVSLLITCLVQAQFQNFDPTIDPQKGCIAPGDINSDGNLDVIYNGVNITSTDWIPQGHIMINNGNNTFSIQSATNVVVTGGLSHIEYGDIDADGDLDIIFQGTQALGVNSDQSVGIALNNGTGVFTLADPVQYPTIKMNGSCGFADFNNDGLLDYYIIGNFKNSALFIHQSDGSFVKDNTFFMEYEFVDPQVSIADFNNDGFIDFFITAWKNAPLASGEVVGRFSSTFVNDGFGHFTLYPQPNIIPKSYGTATWGDVDGDGWLDLLLNGDGWVNTTENSDGVVRLYKNNNGTLIPRTTFSFFRQLSVGQGNKLVDWDNDGKMDVICGGWSDIKQRQTTSLFLCSDATNFTYSSESDLSNTLFPGVSENSYEVADLNNDGKTDLLLMGYNGNQVGNPGGFSRNICGWIPNPSTISTIKPLAPTGLSSAVSGTEGSQNVTLNWNAPTSEISKMGTTYNISLRNITNGKWYYNPMAFVGGNMDGKRMIAGMGNVFTNKSWTLYGLPAGNYEWTVQAVNGGFFGGNFAEIKTFTIAGISTDNSQMLMNKFEPSIAVDGNKLLISNRRNNLSMQINIFTINGTCISKAVVTGDYQRLLEQGIYLIQIKSDEGIFNTRVVMK